MEIIFEVIDKTGRKIHLSKERYRHIQKHPHMHDSLDIIKMTIQNPITIRYNDYMTTAQVAKASSISWNTALAYLEKFYKRGWVDKLGDTTIYWRAILEE